ncbi:MAG: ATP-dependent helicase [Candidatus Nomurabacteria bacterium]|jgi:DNA helicase-2/ATP-dependent DNA helicase PcrA|nr:ATP-dependent helicase [Candidatus Nomurabacteria bacterium]
MFDKVYQNLNQNQRAAVDAIDGPVLVIAGPGTGKTQLLSARVANILRKTDMAPENILCLTYTDSGAFNMRERLNKFIGSDSYKVTIGTFHSFGQSMIYKYRDYFAGKLETPIDELGQHQIITQIVSELNADDLLKYEKINNIKMALAECKKNNISADGMRRIAEQNMELEAKVNQKLDSLLGKVFGKTKLDLVLPVYQQVWELLGAHIPKNMAGVSSLQIYADELAAALDKAENSKPLTAWKNKNTDKNYRNQFVLKNHIANKKLLCLAHVYEQYQKLLSESKLYDFDDMILEVIKVLENHDEVRFSLQEQYQYILLDEYQDTNRSQAKIVELLTNNPVSEGRPNVMAVGDDDQAIMSFQGAESSNLNDFAENYLNTKIINLSDNYRSAQHILDFAKNISQQITSKPNFLANITKTLSAAKTVPETTIQRAEFKNDVAECKWIAEIISQIPENEWGEVAILAPKHKNLAKILPFIREKQIAVNYERKENILDNYAICQIVDILELVNKVLEGEIEVRHLWVKVLSQEFWQIAPVKLWDLAWGVRQENKTYPEVALASDDENLKNAMDFLLQLAMKSENETFDTILNTIINGDGAESPFKKYYLAKNAQVIYDTVSALTILRDKFEESPYSQSTADFLSFVRAHKAADIKILDTNPFKEAKNAINLMTVHKSKGLEFKYVFLPFVSNANWNKSAGNDNSITLPNNLRFVRRSSIENDEKLRLFFVAVTRAKSHLYITNSTGAFSGKKSERLAYLNEIEDDSGAIISQILPAKYRKVKVVAADETPVTAQDIEKLWDKVWLEQHLPSTVAMRDLLAERIKTLRYSASNLTTFFDTKYGGPRKFYESVILQFPSPRSTSVDFGNAIHSIFDKYTREIKNGKQPALDDLLDWFLKYVDELKLGETDKVELLFKGKKYLPKYYAARCGMLNQPAVETELALGFGDRVIAVDDILIRGRVDRIEIDEARKELVIVDFKTGKPKTKKDSGDIALRKYFHQLYFYKMLLEGSLEYKKYKVAGARLEFVESNQEGKIVDALEVTFDAKTEEWVKKLLQGMVKHVQDFDFPEIDNKVFAPTAAGMKKFEAEIIENANL